MPRQFSDGVDRVRVIHKDDPTHDGVKFSIKLQFCRVAFQKLYIADVPHLRPGGCPFNRRSGTVCANNFPAWPYQIGCEKGYVAAAAPHIKNPHPRGDSSLVKELAREGFKCLCLTTKTFEFPSRMT
jgi:hypothetical protein